jgi:hypothetical protein
MKVNQKIGGMEKIKCNNDEIKNYRALSTSGSKTVINGSVTEEIIERIKMQ